MTPAYVLSDAVEAGVPAGFQRLQGAASWSRHLGPLYLRKTDAGAVVAVRVDEPHLNIQGVAHGGMLTTLADTTLGINIALARSRRGGQVTVSLTADFLSSARQGDWLEAHVTITRMGRTLAYANCDLRAEGRHVLRASGVFAFVERPLPPGVGAPLAAPDPG